MRCIMGATKKPSTCWDGFHFYNLAATLLIFNFSPATLPAGVTIQLVGFGEE